MARMRYVKPTFWTDSRMVRLSRDARLFYIGTWNFAICDKGHLEDDPLQLKMQIFPADDVDVRALMGELIAAGRLTRVTDGEVTWLQIGTLEAHQKVDSRWKPRCPACSSPNLSETPVSLEEIDPKNPSRTQKSLGEALTSTDAKNPPENNPDAANLSETLPNSPQEGRGGDRRGEFSSSEIADAMTDQEDAPREDVEHLCTLLADLIESNGLKRPTITKKWRDASRLMLDRDKRDPTQAERLIRWTQTDEFWRGNVLSMPKFRDKYDQLLIRARSSKSNVRSLPIETGHAKPKPRTVDPDAPFQPRPVRPGEENRIR